MIWAPLTTRIMRGFSPVVVAVLLAAIALPCRLEGEDRKPSESGNLVWLQWRNGDRLQGRLEKVDAESVTFESPLFEGAITIDRKAVAAVRRSSSKPADNGGESVVRVILGNGDVLFGKLVEISNDSVVIESARHGRVALIKDRIARIDRAAMAEVLFESTGRLNEWKAFRGELSHWEERLGGGLVTRKFGAGIAHELELSEKSRVQIALNWNEGPGFSLMLVHPGAQSGGKSLFGQLAKGLGLRSGRSSRTAVEITPLFHLTLWDDELVVETRTGFTPIWTLDKDAKELQAELMWDRTAGKLWVVAGKMSKPVAVDVPKFRSGWKTGVYFRNFGEDVELESVQVMKWDGTMPAEREKKGRAVILVDGTGFDSPAREFDVKQGMLVLADGTNVAIDRVARIVWNREAGAGPRNMASDQAKFTDGTVVHGKLSRADGQAMWFETEYAAQPLRCRYDSNLIELQFSSTGEEAAEKLPWILRAGGGELTGRVALVESNGKARLAWRPAGVAEGAALAATKSLEIEKIQEEPLRKVIAVSAMPDQMDVMYLKNKDVVPARAFTLEGDQLTFRLDVGKERTIGVDSLRAIGFQRDDVASNLVEHAKWKEKAERPTDIKREEDRIEFYGGGRLENPDLLTVPAVGFRLKRSKSQFCQVDFALFGADSRQLDQAVHFSLYLQGRQNYYSFYIGKENEQGYSQLPGDRGKTSIDWSVEISGNRKAVLKADGEEIETIDVPKSFEIGHGIRIHMENTPRNRRPVLTISNLKLLGASDPFASVSAKDKQIILQVPRRYRRRPPTHVLLARTGDMLRGRLNGFDEQAVQFTVRTVPQKIPRRRLAGVLWLDPVKKAGDNDQEGKQEGETSASKELPPDAIRVLTATSRMTFVPTRMEDGKLLGESPVVGEVAVPVDQILLIEQGTSLRKVGEAPFQPWRPQVAADPEVPERER